MKYVSEKRFGFTDVLKIICQAISYTPLLNRIMRLDTSAIIFCDIIDNYGDAGFCLRFSRALLEYIKTVAIFTNKPSIFYKVIGENNLILINSSTEILSIFHNRFTSFEIPILKIILFLICSKRKHRLNF